MNDTHDDLRTIKDTNAYLRSLVETPETLKDQFWISGLVKGKYHSDLGHVYFSLEDEQHSISCMLPKRYEDKAVYIKDGIPLDVYGVLGVYEKQAKITFHVNNVRVVELDDSALDKSVIERLEAIGLFPSQKQDLPKNPHHIAIVTSRRSEALSDFENIYREQNGQASIQLADTLLQGEQAVNLIVQRIEELNRDAKADIIVLVRGGGRQEDMSIFNSYEIAEAICKSKIPVVTGIGHQRDETIADRVADQKTVSPTDAAYKLAQLSTKSQVVQTKSTGQAEKEKEVPCLPIAIFMIGLPLIFLMLLHI